MNILITGGVGFIGINSAIYLLKNKKSKITIVDDFSRKGVQRNARFLAKNYPRIAIIRSDINNVRKYRESLKRADVIIHLAAQTAVTTSVANPLLDFKVNLLGGFRLLEEMRRNNSHAIFLYASTNKVYGDLHGHQIKKDNKNKCYKDMCHPKGLDEEERIDFISPYGCSKGALDLYVLDYARIYDIKAVVLRQSCIYGPFQIGVEDQGWVAHFSKQFLSKSPITIYGDGYQVRDLLYIDDLITAYDRVIKNINDVKGEVFNIGGGIQNAYSLLQVIDVLERTIKNKVKITYKKARLGDQKYFVSSNQKVRKRLDWYPKVPFETGLHDLIDWQKTKWG